MEVTATKKTIVILTTCFILLISSCLALFFRDVIFNGIKYGKWFSVDKYEELLEDCNYVKDGKQITVTCNSLLYKPAFHKDDLDTHCYSFLVISKDNNKDTYLTNICDKDANVRWNGREVWLTETRMTPVRFSIIFRSENYINYYYNRLSIENVNDKELFEEFYKNKKVSKLRFPLASKYLDLDDYYNYSYAEDFNLGFKEVGSIHIFSAELIEKKVVEKGKMSFTFKTRIKDEECKILLNSNFLVMIPEDNRRLYIDIFNFEKVEINKTYQIELLYVLEKTQELKKFLSREPVPGVVEHFELYMNRSLILDDKFRETDKDTLINAILIGNGNNTVVIEGGVLYLISN